MMSNEIIKILDDLAKRFGIAIDWTAENVLPYLKELFSRVVKYEIVQSIILMGVACLMLMGIMIAIWKIFDLKKKCEKTHKENMLWWWNSVNAYTVFNDEPGFGICGTIVVLTVIAMTIFAVNLDDALRWSFIPELKLVEWINDAVTANGWL